MSSVQRANAGASHAPAIGRFTIAKVGSDYRPLSPTITAALPLGRAAFRISILLDDEPMAEFLAG